MPLGNLDAQAPKHRELWDYAQLNQQDVTALEAIAQDVSEEAIRYAGKAAFSLRRIEGLIQQARAVNLLAGWIPSEKQVAEWKEAIDSAPKMLDQLEAACRQATAT